MTSSMQSSGTGYSAVPSPSGAFATAVSAGGTRMLSARLMTKATPRRIHIVPRVMMNGWTPSPMIITPLARPQTKATSRQVPRPSSTVITGSSGPAARSTIAIATPDSA